MKMITIRPGEYLEERAGGYVLTSPTRSTVVLFTHKDGILQVYAGVYKDGELRIKYGEEIGVTDRNLADREILGIVQEWQRCGDDKFLNKMRERKSTLVKKEKVLEVRLEDFAELR